MNRASVLFFQLAALVLFYSPVFAQQSLYTDLTGTVINDSTGAPVAGAHVFIAESMIGTVTGNDGDYRLERVPMGAHRLFVSIVGFEPQAMDVVVREGGTRVYDFRLKPTVVELGEVTVEGKENKRWQQQLQHFTRLFIGETPNAEQTRIINPEVLSFDDKVVRFTAKASETLVIENKALGYRIQYFLKEFGATPGRVWYDGEPLYEELTPESPEQAAEWDENRRKAFMGSLRHFLLALISGRAEEQGFATFSRPAFDLSAGSSPGGVGPTATGSFAGNYRFPLDAKTIVLDGSNPSEKKIEFHGSVEIIYMGEMEDPSYSKWIRAQGGGGGRMKVGRENFQTSWIQLDSGSTLIDYKGDTLDPYGITQMGYFAYERAADDVPKEYRPTR